jgi:hypothetical protein
MALRCEEVRERFSALWENELTPAERSEMKGHLDLCDGCREEFSRFEQTLQLLNSVEEVEVPEGFLAGVHEKLEERKRSGLAKARKGGGGLDLPPRFKLPIQAAAMVAVVFLALYLTKMMPGELRPAKDTAERSPQVEEKSVPAGGRTAIPEEKKPEQRLLRQRENQVDKEEVSGSLKERERAERTESKPWNAPAEAPGPLAPRTLKGSRVAESAAPAAGEKAVDQVTAGSLEKRAEEERAKLQEGYASGARPDLQVKAAPAPAISRPKAAETPPPVPLKAKKEEKGSIALRGDAPVASRHLVLRTTDLRATLSSLQELVKQWGGEILEQKDKGLLVSLPASRVSEFQKGADEINSIVKAPAEAASEEKGENAGRGSIGKRRVVKEKDGEVDKALIPKESRTVIQIDLIEE